MAELFAHSAGQRKRLELELELELEPEPEPVLDIAWGNLQALAFAMNVFAAMDRSPAAPRFLLFGLRRKPQACWLGRLR